MAYKVKSSKLTPSKAEYIDSIMKWYKKATPKQKKKFHKSLAYAQRVK